MRLIALLMAAVVVSGCVASPHPPGDLPATNVVVREYGPIFDTRYIPAVVEATCRESKVIKTVRRGDWNDTWQVVTFDVTGVERGKWDERTVSFVCYGSAPTIESGIIAQLQPWPYRAGVRFRLYIDTRTHPAMVIANEAHDSPSPER